MDKGFWEILVTVFTSFAVVIASLKSLLNNFLLAPIFMENSWASFTWPNIWSSPITRESNPDVTLNKCSIASVFFC